MVIIHTGLVTEWSERSPHSLEVAGAIPNDAIPKAFKMELVVSSVEKGQTQDTISKYKIKENTIFFLNLT